MNIYINKLIKSLEKRGFNKEANILEDFLISAPTYDSNPITQCPICSSTMPDPECVLCEGSGSIIPITQDDDEEDKRLIKELKL